MSVRIRGLKSLQTALSFFSQTSTMSPPGLAAPIACSHIRQASPHSSFVEISVLILHNCDIILSYFSLLRNIVSLLPHSN
uniref:Uncharacterized protein n=2 Tax=unclassified Caudoviricetes TaxID=2788787 RepID=A0A8S5VC48_9CAUD|nr:MAG TPA: hypothetical protein [Siphoviridae sp. ctHDv29]DAG04300.1 MAG TPA: hypothetical protein [Siphoviridae sp. ctKsH2]